MKKTALLLNLCVLLAACESGTKKSETGKVSVKAASATELNSDSASGTNLAAVAHQPQVDTSITKIGTEHAGGILAPGVKLMAASDCAGCHKEDQKLVGPAYKDVAHKYAATDANITMLANKVIQGGKGNWGEIPMTPHPGLSVADAKEMTKYVLSLK